MSIYLRPKFKVGQTIFAIRNDKIEQIEIESIRGMSRGICYLSKNITFPEFQCFATFDEAKDFFDNSIRIPFVEGDVVWEGSLGGVIPTKVKEVYCFFKDDLKKPYNMTTMTDRCLNSTSCFENQIEATEYSLKLVINGGVDNFSRPLTK